MAVVDREAALPCCPPLQACMLEEGPCMCVNEEKDRVQELYGFGARRRLREGFARLACARSHAVGRMLGCMHWFSTMCGHCRRGAIPMLPCAGPRAKDRQSSQRHCPIFCSYQAS
eukprot:166249-Chlamydomonas_euryale.AAC.1